MIIIGEAESSPYCTQFLALYSISMKLTGLWCDDSHFVHLNIKKRLKIMSNPEKSLTGLRGYAVLLVLLSHASNEGLLFHNKLSFSGAGRYGVFLFFILSSFLLTKQFLITNITAISLKRYFIRRFLKIYPLFITASILYYLYSFIKPVYITNKTELIKTLLLLDGPGIFWTIPVEFQYYFLIPLISFILIRLKKVSILITFIFITIWQLFFPPVYTSYLLPFLSIFLIGSLIAYIDICYLS